MKKLNLNEAVKFKLTPFGVEVYSRKWDDLPGFTDKYGIPMPAIDSEGFTEMQLHEFARVFGQYIRLGIQPVLIDLTLYIEDEALDEV